MVAKLFTKKSLNRREAQWLDVLASFNISDVSLVSKKLHVLGDSLSRIPDRRSTQQVQVVTPPFTELESTLARYDEDQYFGPISAALDGKWPSQPNQKKRVELLLLSFSKDGWRLLYHGILGVLSHCWGHILAFTHDSKSAGHFAFSKTLARLADFHWKHTTKLVRRYVQGARFASSRKTSPGRFSMTIPLSRSLSVDGALLEPTLLSNFSASKEDLTAFLTGLIDYRGRFASWPARRPTGQAPDVAMALFTHIYPHHGLPDSLI